MLAEEGSVIKKGWMSYEAVLMEGCEIGSHTL